MRLLALPALAFGLTGCATIIEGTTQPVTINVHPDDAVCAVARHGDGQIANTTRTGQTVTVSKSKDPLVVACARDGYATQTVYVPAAVSEWGAASLALSATGSLIDMATGAQHSYPSTVTVILQEQKPLPPAVVSMKPVTE